MPRLGSEVAEAGVAGVGPWSLHPAVLSTRGGKEAGLSEVAGQPCEPALPNLLLPGNWSGQAGTGPLPFSQLLNQGPSQKVGVFTLKHSLPHSAPPGKPLVSTESQETGKVPSTSKSSWPLPKLNLDSRPQP